MKDEVIIKSLPNIYGGTPVIAGTQFPVGELLGLLSNGFTVKEIAEDFNLDREKLEGTLRFLSGQVSKLMMVK